ncbi:MAG: aminoacyl-tRNA deacylase [Bacteroidota bacterium]
MSEKERFLKYLDDNHVRYTLLSHARVFTSQQVAGATHVPGKELAKTVIVKIDEGFAMAVLPAPRKVNLKMLKAATGAKEVRLATEEEMEKLMPACEVGAMPPFGNLYNLPVYVEKSLTEDAEIVFNACTHTDSVRMAYSDFERLVHPSVVEFTESPPV